MKAKDMLYQLQLLQKQAEHQKPFPPESNHWLISFYCSKPSLLYPVVHQDLKKDLIFTTPANWKPLIWGTRDRTLEGTNSG